MTCFLAVVAFGFTRAVGLGLVSALTTDVAFLLAVEAADRFLTIDLGLQRHVSTVRTQTGRRLASIIATQSFVLLVYFPGLGILVHET